MEDRHVRLLEDILAAQVLAIAEARKVVDEANGRRRSLPIKEVIADIKKNKDTVLQEMRNAGLL